MSSGQQSKAQKSRSRWTILAVFFTVAAFLLLSKLSWWQWQRAEEKSAQLAQIAQWQQQDGVALATLAGLNGLDGAPLQGEVRWLSPYSWLLDNQIVSGRVGYDVLVPVQAITGSGPILLVNLGWLPAAADRSVLPSPEIPLVFQLNGVLRTEPRPFLLGSALEHAGQYPRRVQGTVPQALATDSGLALADAVFYQQQTPFVSHYQPVILPPEKHRAYALQWGLLAVAVVFVAWSVYRYQEQK